MVVNNHHFLTFHKKIFYLFDEKRYNNTHKEGYYMEKLMNLEYKKIKMLEEIKEETEDKDIDCNLAYLSYLDRCLKKEISKSYQENPFLFRTKYQELKNRNQDISLIDMMDMTEEQQIEYNIYLIMKHIINKRPKYQSESFIDAQKSFVYIKFLEGIQKISSKKRYRELKDLLIFFEPDLSPFLLLGVPLKKQALDERMAADRIRVVECRKIQEKLEQESLFKENYRTYLYYQSVLLEQIENKDLQMALKQELKNKQQETEGKVIPIYLVYKKRTTHL